MLHATVPPDSLANCAKMISTNVTLPRATTEVPVSINHKATCAAVPPDTRDSIAKTKNPTVIATEPVPIVLCVKICLDLVNSIVFAELDTKDPCAMSQ